MDPRFHPAMAAVYAGDADRLRSLLAEEPELALARSSTSHPTLLCFVGVEGGLGRLPTPGEAARVLVEAGAAMDEALVSAASTGCLDVVDVLLDAGAGIDASEPWTAAEEANYWGNGGMVDHLVSRGAGIRSLRLAAGTGNLDRIRGFFDGDELRPEAGPVVCPFPDALAPDLARKPQHVLDQAFVLALVNRQYTAAGLLLDLGADINGMPTGTHWRGTALHACIDFELPEMAQWLLDAGADRNVRDREFHATPADRARHQGMDDLADLLAPD